MTSLDSPRPSSGEDRARSHGSAELDGPASDAILKAGRFFRRGKTSDDLRTEMEKVAMQAFECYR